MNFLFIFNNIMLGAGLAMDAFSVSLTNGLREPGMKKGRMAGIAGTYAGFQFAMPMIGWICVHTIVEYFESFQKFIPWIALILLLYIGGSMLIEGIKEGKNKSEETSQNNELKKLAFGTLMMQGIATSIDALSVGFTIADYDWVMAVASSLIIGFVTFIICTAGLGIGKNVGTKLSGKASILGGIILIAIGLEIFITGVPGGR